MPKRIYSGRFVKRTQKEDAEQIEPIARVLAAADTR